jgi:hypothetical protein
LVEEIAPFEPIYLCPDISVDDIAFLVLETPGNDDEEVPFTYPETFPDLALDPPDACYAVLTTDPYVVCPKHQISPGKHLPVSLLR